MTASPSASLFVAVAVTRSSVDGEAGASVTPAVGALFATTAPSVTVGPSTVPSFGCTSTVTPSPRPALAPRSSVSVSAPVVVVLTTVPETFQV